MAIVDCTANELDAWNEPESLRWNDAVARVREMLVIVALAPVPISPDAVSGLSEEIESGSSANAAVSLLGQLVYQSPKDQSLRFINHSFSDFIVDPARCIDHRFLVHPGNDNAWMARRCLELLNDRRQMILMYPSEFTEPGSARYAIRAWAHHLHAALVNQETRLEHRLVETFEEFVGTHILEYVLSAVQHYPAADVRILGNTVAVIRDVCSDLDSLTCESPLFDVIGRDRSEDSPKEAFASLQHSHARLSAILDAIDEELWPSRFIPLPHSPEDSLESLADIILFEVE